MYINHRSGLLLLLCGIALTASMPAQKGIVQGQNLGTLVVHAETDSGTYSLGKPVRVRISGTNKGSTSLMLQWPNSCVYDFAVIDSTGNEVYRLSRNVVCAQVITEVKIEPGKTRNYDGIWNQVDNAGMSARPGEYHLRAWLVGQESDNAATIRLEDQSAETSTTTQNVSEFVSPAAAALLVMLALIVVVVSHRRRSSWSPIISGYRNLLVASFSRLG
jgi:hypothetical protein